MVCFSNVFSAARAARERTMSQSARSTALVISQPIGREHQRAPGRRGSDWVLMVRANAAVRGRRLRCSSVWLPVAAVLDPYDASTDQIPADSLSARSLCG